MVHMIELVIDTSVIIKWYAVHQEPGFERAKTLLVEHATQHCRLHIPMLALYEAGNALRYGTTLSEHEQVRSLADLFALGLSVYPLTLARAAAAHELSAVFGTSFYDACFVALAQELDVTFVTADERLHRRIFSLPFAHTLASYQLA